MDYRWRIDPNYTSAKEVLWDCLRVNAIAFKNRARARGLRLDSDEWAEVVDIVMFTAYRRFMNKLHEGRYNRSVSFYLNVRGAVWEVFYQQTNQYINNVVHKKQDSIDRLEPERSQYLLDNAAMPRYVSNESERNNAQANLKTWMTGSTHGRHRSIDDIDDFWTLLESAEEMGLPVKTDSPDYLYGCLKATGERPEVKMIIIRDSVLGDAVMGSLLIGGSKICDTLENKNFLIPCGSYKVSVSKSPKFGRMLPLIWNEQVSQIRGVRIHAGNRAADSRACILVGFGRCNNSLLESRKAEDAVTQLAMNDTSLIITTNGSI
jgi:hypothetical protein